MMGRHRPDQARDQVEAGGLARAIGAQQAHDFAPAQFEADAAHHGALLEGLNDVMNGQAPRDGLAPNGRLAVILGLRRGGSDDRLTAWK